ncbi:MAG: hypothetical protein L3J35_04165 [Bacteroidales bacterium]|nr:hypothetical protein [Bacteroidales bacterium]
MKKSILIFATVLFIFAGTVTVLTSCGNNEETEQIKEKEAWACPMKCEGKKTYDKAGQCPVCGMNLKEEHEHNH